MLPEGFHTARLTFRPIAPADAAAIFDGYARDPAVARYMPWRPHASIAETESYVADCMDAASARTYVVAGRAGGELRGVFEVRRTGHRIGFGYTLARPYWGRGLMTEALRAVVGWALGQDGVWRVGDVCDAENAGSARVMEKAGLMREGVLRRWAVRPNIGGEPRDFVSYAAVR